MLEKISNLAEAIQELVAKRNAAQAQVAEMSEQIVYMTETLLPSLMDDCGMESFTTTSGLKIAVRETISAKISDANKNAAFDWLDANAHGDIIKTQIVTEFGRGENERAREFMHRIQSDGNTVALKETVHPQTLGALVRELMEKEEEVPNELLGVYVKRAATIST